MSNIGLCVIFAATLVAFTGASDAVVDASFRVHSQPRTLMPEHSFERIPLNRTVLSPYQIRYTIGQRQGGDGLTGQKSDNLQWSQPQNVQLRLDYNGPTLTFVDITVIQTSTSGNAYVVAGGVGQRQISVIVEGWYTTKFQYTGNFYGR